MCYSHHFAEARFVDEVSERDDTDEDTKMTQHPAVTNLLKELGVITTDALNIFAQSLG